MATYTKTVLRATEGELLISAKVVLATTFTYNGTNYWTFTLWHRASGETNGRTIGAALSTASRTLTARSPATLYDTAGGLTMSDGDELVLTVASTGSPAALDDPRFIYTSQRLVR